MAALTAVAGNSDCLLQPYCRAPATSQARAVIGKTAKSLPAFLPAGSLRFNSSFGVSLCAGLIVFSFKELPVNQRELNREVSQKTGETISTIAALGFVPLTGQPFEREPQTVDWDENDAQRNVAVLSQRTRTPAIV